MSSAATPARPRKLLKRRSIVMDSAAAVFAARGYHAATTKDIADKLGLRAGSLYYYWESKEAALEEVCRLGGQEFAANMAALVLDRRPAVELVRDGIRQHLNSDKLNYVTCFVFQRRFLPARLQPELNESAKLYVRQWEELIRRGVKSGEFHRHLDPRIVAFAALSLVNGAVAYLEGRRSEAERRNFVDALAETFLAGVQKR